MLAGSFKSISWKNSVSMKRHCLKLSAVLLCLSFYACKNDSAQEDRKKAQDSILLSNQKDGVQLNDLEGSIGILNIPEMISLCVLDSAPEPLVAIKMSQGFATLEKDLQEIGAERNGPPGLMYHNNDATNFKFECLQPIFTIPVILPKHSKVVTFKAERMLVYNYYGAYTTTYKAYEEIHRLCEANNLFQSGPMREFYPAVALKADSSRKLTQIMVPVTVKGK